MYPPNEPKLRQSSSHPYDGRVVHGSAKGEVDGAQAGRQLEQQAAIDEALRAQVEVSQLRKHGTLQSSTERWPGDVRATEAELVQVVKPAERSREKDIFYAA